MAENGDSLNMGPQAKESMDNKKLYDVSLTISNGMVAWPGDPEVNIKPYKSIKEGASSNVSILQLGSHTGTHIDVPYHFINEGSNLDDIPIELFVGRARLFELQMLGEIGVNDLKQLNLNGVSRILFKTRNSDFWKRNEGFRKDFVYLSGEGAKYLVDAGIKMVGIDYLSVEEFGNKSAPAHHTLLGAGIVIIEGLNLSGVKEGEYKVICAPLKIKGGDGAPARVFLEKLD